MLAWIAMALTVLLIAAMCYEVIARYGLNSPTVWSIDLSFMFNGAMFLLAAGYTLRMDRHVRVDILSARMPVRVQNALNVILLACIFIPCIAWLGWTSASKAVSAYQSGERELSSAWGPVVWPFYAAIAVGFLGLVLQAAAETVRRVTGFDRVREPS